MAKRDPPEKTHPVTIRIPWSKIEAINEATLKEERESASEMIRIMVDDWLTRKGYYKKKIDDK